MPITKAKLCVIIASILIDVLNLGEQFGIYFAQQAEEIDEMKQRQFFFILLGISAVTLLKSIFLDERIKIGILFLIEIGELLSYLFILERTLAVMVISLTFFGLQFVCYIIRFYLVKTDDETQIPQHRLKVFLYRLAFYICANGGPLLTLFLNSESRFRQSLYEVSLIIWIFVCSAVYEVSTEIGLVVKTWKNRIRVEFDTDQASLTQPDAREFMKNGNAIEHRWALGNYIVFTIFGSFYLPILLTVLASLELKENGSQLPSYDRVICIWLLVSGSVFLLFIPYICCIAGFFVCINLKDLSLGEDISVEEE